MKRIVYILIYTSLLISCHGAKVKIYEKWPNGQPKITLEYFDKSDTNSYIMRSYFENGKLELESEIIDQKMNGVSKYYYPNGQLKYIAHLKDNMYNGKLTFWYQNGEIWQELNYQNGLYSDSVKEYYPGGKIKFQGSFINGNGIIEYYYRNSQLMRKGKLQNNKETGLWIDYDSIGRKNSEGKFVNGRKDGEYTNFDTLGVVIETGRYENGMLVEVKYFKNGKEVLQNINDIYESKRNKIPWTNDQRQREINDCIKQKLSENHTSPNDYCPCIFEIIEQFLSYQEYLQASDVEINELINRFGQKCK